MKIKIKRPIAVRGKHYKAGDVIEVDSKQEAQYLLNSGLAGEASTVKAKK
jgi:hypothetical protein